MTWVKFDGETFCQDIEQPLKGIVEVNLNLFDKWVQLADLLKDKDDKLSSYYVRSA